MVARIALLAQRVGLVLLALTAVVLVWDGFEVIRISGASFTDKVRGLLFVAEGAATSAVFGLLSIGLGLMLANTES